MAQLKKWKKIGGGTFRTRSGKIVKPNEIFSAYESDIPGSFRDTIIALESTSGEMTRSKPPVKKDEPKVEEPKVEDTGEFKLKERSTGWFDVVSSDGKPINENALRKNQAEALIEDLNS